MDDRYDSLPSQISPEMLEEYGDDILGVKIIAVCHNRGYFGVVKHVCKDVKRIWLIKASTLKNQIPIMGVLTLFYSDIKFLSVLHIDIEVKKKMLQQTAEDVKRSRKLVMKRVEIPTQDDQVETVSMAVPDDSPNSPVLPYGICIHPNKVEEFSRSDGDYTSAMAKINSEDVVGVVVRGKNIGREGELSWISVATRETIYHFDVLKLGFQYILESGLRTLLEHQHRVKVIHDGRSFQDYLLHKHKCQMQKVFDVQFTDWYGRMVIQDGRGFLLAKDFKDILKSTLPSHEKHIPHTLSNPVPESEWMERPLADHLKLECDFCVMYLLELRQVMLDYLLSHLQQQTDVFGMSITKMDKFSADTAEHMIIPKEVQNMWQKKSSDTVVYTMHNPANVC